MLGEAEGTMGDAVHVVQRDPLDLVTVEHDKVVLDDQQGVFCDEDNSLLFVIPVVNPIQK